MKHFVIQAAQMPRTLAIYKRSTQKPNYLRSYRLEDAAQNVLLTADAFGNGFAGSVFISAPDRSSPIFMLRPECALFNTRYKLIGCDDLQMSARVEASGHSVWQVLDDVGQVLVATNDPVRASTAYDYRSQAKIERPKTYQMVSKGKVVALTQPSAPNESGLLRKAMSKLIGQGDDARIQIDFAHDFHLDPTMIMSLMMVHHERRFVAA